MALVRDACICLRKIDYSETSQILLLFSRAHGLVRVIAKGAHRRTKAGASKFDGGLDLLEMGDGVFTHDFHKDLCILTEWSLREGHPDLRRTLRGLYLGLYAAELVSLLIEEHDPHPDLFDRLGQTLLEVGSSRAEEAFLAFGLDLLRETGYLPELTDCASCGQAVTDTGAGYFSPNRGGVVCRDCEGTVPDRLAIDLRLLRLVQGILRLPRVNGSTQRLPRLTRHQTDPLNALLANHVEHTLGKRLRMPRYVLGRTSPVAGTTVGRTFLSDSLLTRGGSDIPV
ncbi:MAG: DNA repair protein RecO [Tepidisphaeraceae bacterium]